MHKEIRLLISFLMAALIFVVVMVVDTFLIGAISKVTGSGLLGICGPYGSDVAIYSMLAILAAGPIAGVWVGIVAGRRYFKWRSGAQPERQTLSITKL